MAADFLSAATGGAKGNLDEAILCAHLIDAAQRLSRYLLTQLSINLAFGASLGLGLFFIGVPHYYLWGFLAALLRFIPYVGSWMAAAFPPCAVMSVTT